MPLPPRTKTPHLVRKFKTWIFVLGVPADLQAKVGKKQVSVSLKTADFGRARELRDELLISHRRWFRQLREQRQTPTPWTTPADILRDARGLRTAVELGEDPAVARQAFGAQAFELECDHQGDPLPEDLRKALGMGERVLKGEALLTLADAVQRHLGAVRGTLAESTWRARKRRLDALMAWTGETPLEGIDRRQAGEYITGQVLPGTGATKTRKDTVSDLSAAFAWMVTAGLIETNPFSGLTALVRESKRGTEGPRRPWTDAELARLLEHIRSDLGPGDYLHRLVRVAMYSGMRLDEVCNLVGRDIEEGCFVVRSGKTAAAVRRVPIHPELASEVAGLAPGAYLIPGLKPAGQDNKRGHSASKRFGRYIRTWGFPDALVFHGLRASFIAKLEAVGVPVGVCELLVGHARSSLSYGLYSKGVPLDVMREAVHRLDYKLNEV